MTEYIMQFFEYKHLPKHLQKISASFGALAADIVETVPRNPERTVALRKLLESKDAAVRAAVSNDTAQHWGDGSIKTYPPLAGLPVSAMGTDADTQNFG